MDLYFRLNPVALTLLIPGLISTALAIYILCTRRVAGSRVFAFVNIAVAVSSLAYGAELASLNIESMMLVTEIEYLGIASLPVLWLILTLIYTGHNRWVRVRYVVALFIIPFITVVLVSTSQFQHLYYSFYRPGQQRTFSAAGGNPRHLVLDQFRIRLFGGFVKRRFITGKTTPP